MADETVHEDSSERYSSISEADNDVPRYSIRKNKALPKELQDYKLPNERILKYGYFEKEGHIVKNWRQRQFVLTPSQLIYFEIGQAEARGVIPLREIRCAIAGETTPDALEILTYQGRKYKLRAYSEARRNEWLRAIGAAHFQPSTLVQLLRDTSDLLVNGCITEEDKNHLVDQVMQCETDIELGLMNAQLKTMSYGNPAEWSDGSVQLEYALDELKGAESINHFEECCRRLSDLLLCEQLTAATKQRLMLILAAQFERFGSNLPDDVVAAAEHLLECIDCPEETGETIAPRAAASNAESFPRGGISGRSTTRYKDDTSYTNASQVCQSPNLTTQRSHGKLSLSDGSFSSEARTPTTDQPGDDTLAPLRAILDQYSGERTPVASKIRRRHTLTGPRSRQLAHSRLQDTNSDDLVGKNNGKALQPSNEVPVTEAVKSTEEFIPSQPIDIPGTKNRHNKPHGMEDNPQETRQTLLRTIANYSTQGIITAGTFDQHFSRGRELGKGGYSSVYEVVEKSTGRRLAGKFVLKGGLEERVRKAFVREVRVMRQLNHPNIVGFEAFFDEADMYILITELLEGGELFDQIVRKRTYTEREARDVVKTVAEAVAYMHQRGIAHRDLKPENILLSDLTPQGTIKLADMGFASVVPDDLLSTACGTPSYVAPEVLRGLRYDEKTDCWSLGVITFILLCGYPPFQDPNQQHLFNKIKSAMFFFDAPYWTNVSDTAKDLIRKLLVRDPTQRLSASEILQHDWITGTVGNAELTLAIDALSKFTSSKRNKVRSGLLTKQGQFVKNWKERLFVLTGEKLSYFDPDGTKLRGCIPLTEIKRVRYTSDQNSFVIDTYGGRHLHVQAADASTRRAWVKDLNHTRAQLDILLKAEAARESGAAEHVVSLIEDAERLGKAVQTSTEEIAPGSLPKSSFLQSRKVREKLEKSSLSTRRVFHQKPIEGQIEEKEHGSLTSTSDDTNTQTLRRSRSEPNLKKILEIATTEQISALYEDLLENGTSSPM